MLEFVEGVSLSYAALFPIVNPLGASILFLSLIDGSSPQEIHQLALKIALFSVIMLWAVLVVGTIILKIFGITIPIILISGGLLLFYIGWTVLNAPDPPDLKSKLKSVHTSFENKAFYPLTMPVTVGPCCIAIVVALGAHGQVSRRVLVAHELGYAVGIALIGLTIYLCYRYADQILLRLGSAGTHIIMRLVAFLNVCIGLEIIWRGLSELIVHKPFL